MESEVNKIDIFMDEEFKRNCLTFGETFTKEVEKQLKYWNQQKTIPSFKRDEVDPSLLKLFSDKFKTFYFLKDLDYKEPKPKPDNTDINIIWESDLKDYKEEEKNWIIDKLIPSKSICILTGKRGTLKTFIMLQMAYSIATGNSFINKYPTKKGCVIYLDKENGIGIMKKRTEMIKKGMGIENEELKIGFICFSQLKLDKFGDIAAIEKVIEEYTPKLLIVDTYRRSVRFDENDAGKVSQLFVDTLRPIVEKYNTSIVLIHHNRKSAGGNSSVPDEMDELRGSSDLANYADIILKTERKGEFLILKQLKNRNAEEEKPVKIKFEFIEEPEPAVNLTYEGEFLKQNQSEKFCEQIILWIEDNEILNFKTADIRELALKEGVKRSNLHNALITLQDRGIIETTIRGIYNVKNI